MQKLFNFLLGIAAVSLIFPGASFAAVAPAQKSVAPVSKLQYGGWIPFWKKAEGIRLVTANMDSLRQISPFSYEVKADGTLIDSLKINSLDYWPVWLAAIHDANIKVIPTIANLNGSAIYKLLSNKKTRANHIAQIMKMANKPYIDGVDIDYEDKPYASRSYFSAFIKELGTKLHAKKKLLACTVESRMPLKDRFAVIPKNFQFANDYNVLNKYCDEVRIMAYDQRNVDLALNDAKGNGEYYMPVADTDWVEKVIKETVKTLSRKKIMLGVPTYGYEYAVAKNGSVIEYKLLKSHTYVKAAALAAALGVTPLRNNAGELSFTYSTGTTMIADSVTSTTRLVWFPDAESSAQKINLAKKYSLKGVVFFKFDGEMDPVVWEKMKR